MADATSLHAARRSRFERCFDPGSNRLVWVGAVADSDFWDRRWLDDEPTPYARTPPARSLVVRETARYLPAGSLVLEGGCGLAADSWNLHRLGFRTLALDYAHKTLQYVRSRIPQVRPHAGDVSRLPLRDASVDGYWSLGVIEHFYDGYAAIRDEMARVVRPGGYLFLTFPAMSFIRRAKARFGLYPRWEPERRDRFYQFGLSGDRVAADFERHGFALERQAPYLGVTGLCEELGGVGRALERTLSGRALPIRLARAALDSTVRALAYHVRLLVLRRR